MHYFQRLVKHIYIYMFPIDLLVISRPEYLLAPTLWSLSTLFLTPVTSRCIFGHWSNYTCDNYTWSVLTSCRPLADFRVLLISPSGAEDVILIISIVYIQHILFLVFWKNVFVLGGWVKGIRFVKVYYYIDSQSLY